MVHDDPLKMTKLRSVLPVMQPSQKSALLTYGETKFEIPIIQGTGGVEQLDIQALYAKAKLFNFDPGFGNTSSCKSAIT